MKLFGPDKSELMSVSALERDGAAADAAAPSANPRMAGLASVPASVVTVAELTSIWRITQLEESATYRVTPAAPMARPAGL